MARLVCTSGPLEGRTFELEGGLTIGRGPHNGIAMPKDGKASRDHCKVWKAGPTTYAVADLGSTNGTQINGGTITRTDLRDGDAVQVGGATFRFELDPSEKPKPKPSAAAADSGRTDLAAILRGEAKPERTVAAGLEGAAAIEIKQRILQYHKKSATKCSIDVGQTAGLRKYVIYAIVLVVAAGIFWAARGLFGGSETRREGQRPASTSPTDN